MRFELWVQSTIKTSKIQCFEATNCQLSAENIRLSKDVANYLISQTTKQVNGFADTIHYGDKKTIIVCRFLARYFWKLSQNKI